MTTTTSSTASSTSALVAQINASSSGSSSGTASSTKAMSDQFLKLLITQIQNQDPLNPTDNAQFTSQLAQINTVSGLEKVNESISSMSSQFLQMQAMQSASLVGRSVIVPGNALTVSDGKATGQFELSSAADSVKVDVLSSAGRVIDTIDIGAETSGRHQFSLDAGRGRRHHRPALPRQRHPGHRRGEQHRAAEPADHLGGRRQQRQRLDEPDAEGRIDRRLQRSACLRQLNPSSSPPEFPPRSPP